MIVKAYWKSINPFRPRGEDLAYSKTVEVPDGTDLEELKKIAIEDSKQGYQFARIEVVTEKGGLKRLGDLSKYMENSEGRDERGDNDN